MPYLQDSTPAAESKAPQNTGVLMIKKPIT
jgi:hypothetical protein